MRFSLLSADILQSLLGAEAQRPLNEGAPSAFGFKIPRTVSETRPTRFSNGSMV
jgi:hypothetical protein